jgi:hypothetical protein
MEKGVGFVFVFPCIASGVSRGILHIPLHWLRNWKLYSNRFSGLLLL